MHEVCDWKLPTGYVACERRETRDAEAARDPADLRPPPLPKTTPTAWTPPDPTTTLDAPSLVRARAAGASEFEHNKTLLYAAATPASAPPRSASPTLRDKTRTRPPLSVTCMLIVAVVMFVVSGGMALHSVLGLL